MLQLAREYGCMIITNDKFRNHDEFQSEAMWYNVTYGNVPADPPFQRDLLLKGLYFARQLQLHSDYRKLFTLLY